MFKRILSRNLWLPLLGSLFCLLMCINVYAKDARLDIPDLNKTGSISVKMRANDTGEPITGGTMTLYKIGRYVWWDNVYQFKVDRAFTEDPYSHYLRYEKLNDELAHDLLEYANKNSVEGDTQIIDDSGNVSFKNLQPGLYLLTQKEPPEGYYSVKPFFVTLPLMNGMTGVYDYNVNATPKTQKLEPIISPEPLEPAYYNPAELTPAYYNPAELTPAYYNPAELTPAYHNPAELTPAYYNPAELTPAYHNPVELEPAYHNPVELEPAYHNPAELEPAYMEPIELEPAKATPSDAEPDDNAPIKTTSHRSNSGGGGSSLTNNVQMNEEAPIEDNVWEIAPMPKTGERQNIIIGGILFALSGFLLIALIWLRYKMKNGIH